MALNRRTFIRLGTLATAGCALHDTLLYATVPAVQPENRAVGVLRKHFLEPPDASKSSGYWWWFNGRVDRNGITRDLEEFHNKGIGEVLLVNTAGGLGGVPYPQGAKFLSDEWRALYRHAMSEAKRLNIGVGINMSSGWCMGGPWIEPQDAGRWYLQAEMELDGPQNFSGALPLPGNRSGYKHVFNPPGYKDYIDLPLEQLDYRDTAVVAIPVQEGARLNDRRAAVLPAKANRRDASNFARASDVYGPALFEWSPAAGDRPIAPEAVIDLSNCIDPEGNLQWAVPQGKWKIIRTGHRMTGSRLMIAQPEADGLSIGWFDRRGVEIQFEKLGRIFIEEAARVGNKPLYFCDDSFEDGFPNWTDRIITQFKKYRGYDPVPYLPVLSGYLVGSAGISDRFLHDYRKTMADLMADEHYGRFAELCHEHGMLVQNESAGPSRSATVCLDGMKNLGRSDFPMGEFWLGITHEDEATLAADQPYGVSRLDSGYNKVTKMVASAAHTYGKKMVSAEAFTSMRHWLDYPGSLKQSLDRAFCEGVNRVAIHTLTASRPSDGKPGYEYGAGTHFNPNVTWWEFSKPFLDYIARSQHLLRQGHFVADVLFYTGDFAPNVAPQKHVPPTLGAGYDYDHCNEEVLVQRLESRAGKLILPDGMTYRLLVLPDLKRMSLEALEKIVSLVQKGATVLGPPPGEVSGLKNYPQCDGDLKALVNKLWGSLDGHQRTTGRFGKGRIIWGKSAREVLSGDGVLPDFEYRERDKAELDFIHRKLPEADVYFVSNRHGRPATAVCSFRDAAGPAELWDPVTGKSQPVAFDRRAGRADVQLQFHAFQSWFLVFPHGAKAVRPIPVCPAFQNRLILDRPWSVAFDAAWGGPAQPVLFGSLTDWTAHEDERIRYYSGKAVYHTTFSLPHEPAGQAFIDLGTVKNIASVKLNGQDLGIVWTAPWHAAAGNSMRSGNNELEVTVINLWPNRLLKDATLPKSERLTTTNIQLKKDARLLSSGLLGPVTVKW
ncbi:glycosyl transferase family 2 [Pedobacter yulinensis]|uniref:Glycosyl transferase family 2 n=1 Tax=Pedobacter yulinensis TaxID=2126353 RepID=A0A2T3HLS2_9SPHI|nr:glycosyl hydrolase [Pedobacter yulinensis]PST83387.1 glycosyl transferase family 2 [Pedobacter yulinensis]